MATIELQQVEKKFGELHAVKPMDLTIQDGEFVVLLGPSGCGKTTTLRMISGLESVTSGTILLGGRNVTWLHPSERDVAFVFQFYALYPHISARDNISFPLRAQRESKEVIDQRVKEVAALLRIEHLLNQRPGNLSGGDQQRIAPQGANEIAHVEITLAIDAEIGHLVAVAFEILADFENGRMLDGRGDDVTALRVGGDGAEDRGVVAFGCAGGEEDLGRLGAPEQARNLLPGLGDRIGRTARAGATTTYAVFGRRATRIIASRIRRFARFRSTALPTRREATIPTSGGPVGPGERTTTNSPERRA